ncbi:Isochorismatase hydrolase [Hypoxylon trugodes]|uniref:Isochorismatase hydrolase n=1 Tax=Hypoxylon trugodes TaxID=326681 RepID=UPI00218E36F6|nr:Isochorismatase hydrolase [Hypoxylon trugodes]KAI1391786.1 Isochorismatase hydrolase [Hypoxylon trugodes]
MVTTHQEVEETLTFGKNYAVLNLDLMTVLINAVKDTTNGREFISNCSRWNDAVHKKESRPLTIFTTLFFNSGEPELAKTAPFGKLLEGFGSFAAKSDAVQIAPNFTTDEKDIVLQKTRWYAGAGNSLEQILRAQNIDTVILSGLSLSGVVMSTVYRLFDFDYNIFVISDNVLELPPSQHPEYARVMLDSLLAKMNLRVISIEDALKALEKS